MEAIYKVGGSLELAITLPDERAKSKSGRVYLDEFCERNAIHLHKSTHINNQDCIDLIKKMEIDWLFIIGWSQIANEALLDAPKKGVLGIHPTLLPVGRGRAPIPWSIIKGLDKTGVTLFKLDTGVDTGDILAQLEIALTDETTATWLYEQVDQAHVTLIERSFSSIASGNIELRVQDESQATVWEGRKPEDGEIDLNGRREDAYRLVRGVTRPYPGAYFYEDGQKVIVWQARPVSERHDATRKYLTFDDGLLEVIESEVVS
ncbi:formyltransferase family protein [Pseudoalteromonas sp. OOF1S-7]|uniref:formyltransferase family protein n=1 Tax=Pseudoalteromonas sp. OOF1S-7 TaxID=2917757 RepID=UPI001EF60D74|nr:formyltransferase family protein [Pseudoalteromonas sp. OOF1S-7]MCG7536333.1 methionyl-tRNA formyltransferase [Pseudoalteromonas sp. OOF1S-7]